MPLRLVKETTESLFSRTIHARGGQVVRGESHDVPPSQTPEITSGDENLCPEAETNALPAEHDDSETDNLDDDMSDTQEADCTSATHTESVAAMMGEPLPHDTVSDTETLCFESPVIKLIVSQQLAPEEDETATFEESDFKESDPRSHLREFLQALYAVEGLGWQQGTDVRCQKCSTHSARNYYRCIDCFGRAILCPTCMKASHFPYGDPFHRIEKLSFTIEGEHLFTRAALSDDDCLCSGGPSVPLQFMQMTLFPATYERIKTAVTFKALKISQLHNFGGKESVWDFYEVVRRWTNNVDPLAVPAIYPQFRSIKQIWCTLQMIKRSGHLELEVPHGSLVNWMDDPLA
ncbi:hypothetical protein FRC00_008737 [Tulasnella sp. 408]|nr:hypothetical protein FRC00_008737 [Tulasnella sp. 408]